MRVGVRASITASVALVLAAALVCGGEARAGMIMQAYTHGQFSATLVTNNIVTGYRFTPHEDIIVRRLGVSIPFQQLPQPDIIVGLWSESGQMLLATTTVIGGNVLPIEGGSRFADIAPVQLDAGSWYRIGMHIPPGADGYYNLNHPRNEHPLIEFGVRYFHQNTNGLGYPQFNAADLRVSGPNFQFVFVPTPGAATLAFVASILFAPRRRRAPSTRAP
ncbi:MAG: hypothetical protein EA379_12430 [Phycisphaerales bacterium]|nr:MAG: hypothetical protein EA379_12430 [Phycisphaerales bacterium]